MLAGSGGLIGDAKTAEAGNLFTFISSLIKKITLWDVPSILDLWSFLFLMKRKNLYNFNQFEVSFLLLFCFTTFRGEFFPFLRFKECNQVSCSSQTRPEQVKSSKVGSS